MRVVISFLLASLFYLPLMSQIELSNNFLTLLDEAQIDFIYPIEGKYKAITVPSKPYEKYDFAMLSRKEKIEIRYSIRPFEEKNWVSIAPHAEAMRLVTHLASNDENAVISTTTIKPESLQENFNADWGIVSIFRPKERFSSRKQCKLLALHKEGIGTAFVFFLFDDSTIELDNRFLALQFQQLGMSNEN